MNFLLSLEKEIDFYKMMKNYSLTGNGQILVEKISKKDVSDYGIVDLLDNKLSKGKTKIIKDFIEKPSL